MEEAIRAMILPVATCHWGMAPQGAPRPFIVLNRISGIRSYTDAGQDRLVEGRVQVDVYADTYREAKGKARAVMQAVSGRRLGIIRAVFVSNERDLPSSDAEGGNLFRTSVDLTVHHTE